MFLKRSTTTIKGKTYEHYMIAESYRENKKIKHRILFSLGPLTEERAARIRIALTAHGNPDVIVARKDSIVVTKHLAYLDVAVLHQIWREWGLSAFFPSSPWVEAMVLNRLVDPQAKIHIKQWVRGSLLPAYLGVDPQELDEFQVYRALDQLAQREDALQVFLDRQLQRRQPEGVAAEAFFYDITSTYLQGSHCLLAAFGYSRDHRPDRQQVVIALMVNPDGYPFYWRVWEGGTQDVTTVRQLIAEVATAYGIERWTMISGMVSAENIEAAGQFYLSAMDRDEIVVAPFWPEAMPTPVTPENWRSTVQRQGFGPFDKEQRQYFREFTANGRRYVVLFDADRFLDEHQLHAERIREVTAWLEAKNTDLRQAKRKREREALLREVHALLRRWRVQKFLSVSAEAITVVHTSAKDQRREVESFRLSHAINQEAEAKEQRLHGITCFITNRPAADDPATAVIEWYRRKNKVEEAFHEIKAPLQLRPIYLTRAQRVRAHVDVCTLAYFLDNDMERRLRGHAPGGVAARGAARSAGLPRQPYRLQGQRGVTPQHHRAERGAAAVPASPGFPRRARSQGAQATPR